MKETDSNKEYEKIGIKKLNMLSSEALDNSIKNLTSPKFLGSIHMKNLPPHTNFSSVGNLLNGELELKLNKSLKNSMFNPITKILIILMIIFNLIWITILFLL